MTRRSILLMFYLRVMSGIRPWPSSRLPNSREFPQPAGSRPSCSSPHALGTGLHEPKTTGSSSPGEESRL